MHERHIYRDPETNSLFYPITDKNGRPTYLEIPAGILADEIEDSYRRERNSDIRFDHLIDKKFEVKKSLYENANEDSDLNPFENLKDQGASVEEMVLGERKQAKVMRTVEQAKSALTDRQRVALELRFEYNLTYEEIGAVMSTSKQGAKKNVEGALKKLRKVLAKQGITHSRPLQ